MMLRGTAATHLTYLFNDPEPALSVCLPQVLEILVRLFQLNLLPVSLTNPRHPSARFSAAPPASVSAASAVSASSGPATTTPPRLPRPTALSVTATVGGAATAATASGVGVGTPARVVEPTIRAKLLAQGGAGQCANNIPPIAALTLLCTGSRVVRGQYPEARPNLILTSLLVEIRN